MYSLSSPQCLSCVFEPLSQETCSFDARSRHHPSTPIVHTFFITHQISEKTPKQYPKHRPPPCSAKKKELYRPDVTLHPTKRQSSNSSNSAADIIDNTHVRSTGIKALYLFLPIPAVGRHLCCTPNPTR